MSTLNQNEVSTETTWVVHPDLIDVDNPDTWPIVTVEHDPTGVYVMLADPDVSVAEHNALVSLETSVEQFYAEWSNNNGGLQ